MKKLLVFCCVLVFVQAKLFSQMLSPVDPITLAVNGFVIDLDGDTLFGKVAITGMKFNCASKINFTSEDKVKTAFTPEQLIGFGQKRPALLVDFSDLTSISQHWVLYETRKHPAKNMPVFLQKLMDGRIKVFDNPSAVKSSTQIGGLTIDKGSGNYYMEKTGGGLVKVDKKNYELVFQSLFNDCNAFSEALKENPDWKEFKNMPYAADFYNNHCK